jgi:hypothetical protein
MSPDGLFRVDLSSYILDPRTAGIGPSYRPVARRTGIVAPKCVIPDHVFRTAGSSGTGAVRLILILASPSLASAV